MSGHCSFEILQGRSVALTNFSFKTEQGSWFLATLQAPPLEHQYALEKISLKKSYSREVLLGAVLKTVNYHHSNGHGSFHKEESSHALSWS